MGLMGSIGGKRKVQFIVNNNTVIQLDTSIKETHSRSSQATKFPVENGSVISDHVLVSPFSLKITGIISDTPIGDTQQLLTEVATTLTSALVPPVGIIAGAAGYALFSALNGSESPSVQAYNQLLNLQANAQPFDVLTSLYRYANMWITDLTVPRDIDSSNILMFEVSLEQLLIVQPQSVNISIFANPGLSSNKADAGESPVNGAPAGVQKAFSDAGGLGVL